MGTTVHSVSESSPQVSSLTSITNKLTMAELCLKKKEIDAIDFAFDVYDFKGDGKVDAFYAGDLIRACNLNPTLKTIAEVGGTTEKGQKMITKAEVFPMYKACKDSKDQGGFHDFVEILKLYDKNDDNTMLGHELFRLLTNISSTTYAITIIIGGVIKSLVSRSPGDVFLFSPVHTDLTPPTKTSVKEGGVGSNIPE